MFWIHKDYFVVKIWCEICVLKLSGIQIILFHPDFAKRMTNELGIISLLAWAEVWLSFALDNFTDFLNSQKPNLTFLQTNKHITLSNENRYYFGWVILIRYFYSRPSQESTLKVYTTSFWMSNWFGSFFFYENQKSIQVKISRNILDQISKEKNCQ